MTGTADGMMIQAFVDAQSTPNSGELAKATANANANANAFQAARK